MGAYCGERGFFHAPKPGGCPRPTRGYAPMLTDAKVKAARPLEKPYRVWDATGLYLGCSRAAASCGALNTASTKRKSGWPWGLTPKLLSRKRGRNATMPADCGRHRGDFLRPRRGTPHHYGIGAPYSARRRSAGRHSGGKRLCARCAGTTPHQPGLYRNRGGFTRVPFYGLPPPSGNSLCCTGGSE